MAVSHVNDALRVQALGGLTDADVARASGVTPDTVRAWLAGIEPPVGTPAERLSELTSEVDRLSRLIQRDFIAGWMRTSIPLLDGETPLDAFAAGRGRRVASVISGLEDPGAS